MLTLGWGLAAVVGFLAAALVAPHLFLSPSMMVPVLIYALASATLGGWDSPMGAIAGGLLIGVAESLGATFLPFIGAELRLCIPIAVALVVLLACPSRAVRAKGGDTRMSNSPPAEGSGHPGRSS